MSVEVYPRDMVGYGRSPTDQRWPGEECVAVQFILDDEEGAKSGVLHGDAAVAPHPHRG